MSAGTAKSARREDSFRRGAATALEAVGASSATRAVATLTARRRGSCMYGSPWGLGREGARRGSRRAAAPAREPAPGRRCGWPYGSAPAAARLRRRRARPDVAVEPRVQRRRGAPRPAHVLERGLAGDAPLARDPAAREQRGVAQQLDPRVVARDAARRRPEGLARELEPGRPRRGGGALGLRARAVVGAHDGPIALELVACHAVVARPRVEAARREL